MDNARALFEQFFNGGLNLVRKTVSEGWQENLWLDFKVLDGNSAPMTASARQTLAEALSGFANADGGVIVWGIHAASTSAIDPDIAKEMKPIKNLRLFLSNLQSYSSQCVSPAIIGVEHCIVEDEESDIGYAFTFVPKGESEPHMARAKDQHRYYFRSGASFLPMESYMISDRFGRRPQPKLELSYQVVKTGSRGTSDQPISVSVGLILGIKNSGLGIAEYPAIVLFEKNNFKLDRYGLDGNGQTGLPERTTAPRSAVERKRVFAGGVNDVIYPHTVLEITTIRYEIPFTTENWPDQSIQYELYCRGVVESGEISVPIMEHFRVIRDEWNR